MPVTFGSLGFLLRGLKIQPFILADFPKTHSGLAKLLTREVVNVNVRTRSGVRAEEPAITLEIPDSLVNQNKKFPTQLFVPFFSIGVIRSFLIIVDVLMIPDVSCLFHGAWFGARSPPAAWGFTSVICHLELPDNVAALLFSQITGML